MPWFDRVQKPYRWLAGPLLAVAVVSTAWAQPRPGAPAESRLYFQIGRSETQDAELGCSRHLWEGRSGRRLARSNWIVGGKGAWAFLQEDGEQTQSGRLTYLGPFLEYLIPVRALTLGLEVMVGGGGYLLNRAGGDETEFNGLLVADTFVHVYVPLAKRLTLDLHTGYRTASTDDFGLSGPRLGLSLAFGQY